jgi:hypothetical protein
VRDVGEKPTLWDLYAEDIENPGARWKDIMVCKTLDYKEFEMTPVRSRFPSPRLGIYPPKTRYLMVPIVYALMPYDTVTTYGHVYV